MRVWFCALLLGCSLLAQETSSDPAGSSGSFYVDGIVHQYFSDANYTVVAAAHSVINHKFLAVKVRVYNTSSRSVTIKPNDFVVEDAIAHREVSAIGAPELANKMRKPYNMARYAVNGTTPPETSPPVTGDMVSPQFLQMMRAVAARTNNSASASTSNVLYTDTPGALEPRGAPGSIPCDQVCSLRNHEAQQTDPLAQLQRQNTPEYIEDAAFRANTIPPRADLEGVLYYPLGKLATAGADKAHKSRAVRLTVPVEDEKFQLELPVE